MELNLPDGRLDINGRNKSKKLYYGFYVSYNAIVNSLYVNDARKALCHLVCVLKYGDDPEANQHQDTQSWSIH